MKITSAYANKLLRQLNDEKSYLITRETSSCTYTAAIDEEPVVPEYDYADTAAQIGEIDRKIASIKHAVNLANVTSTLSVDGQEMTVDEILVRMAQLNKRKETLDAMRKRLPKTRVRSGYGFAPGRNPEYEYINYDLGQVKADYEAVSKEIMIMQMNLDIHNQTAEFEADV